MFGPEAAQPRLAYELRITLAFIRNDHEETFALHYALKVLDSFLAEPEEVRVLDLTFLGEPIVTLYLHGTTLSTLGQDLKEGQMFRQLGDKAKIYALTRYGHPDLSGAALAEKLNWPATLIAKLGLTVRRAIGANTQSHAAFLLFAKSSKPKSSPRLSKAQNALMRELAAGYAGPVGAAEAAKVFQKDLRRIRKDLGVKTDFGAMFSWLYASDNLKPLRTVNQDLSLPRR
jgi:hypothetical protein